MELIVGMVISTLLIGICFMAYTTLLKQFSNFKESNVTIQEITLTHYLLNKDTDKAQKIYLGHENILVFELETQPPIRYKFEKNFILRESNAVTDTLSISVSNVDITLLDQQLSRTQDALVSGITVSLGEGDSQLEINISKEYDAAQIITQQISDLGN